MHPGEPDLDFLSLMMVGLGWIPKGLLGQAKSPLVEVASLEGPGRGPKVEVANEHRWKERP